MNKPKVVFGVTVPMTMHLLAPVIEEAESRDWSVKVFCNPLVDPRDVQIFRDVDVHPIAMSRSITPLQDARALASWIGQLRHERPEIVVGATPKAAMLSMTAARLIRVPVRVFHIFGARWDGMTDSRGHLLRQMDRLTAQCATDVLSVSDSLADLYQREHVTRQRPQVIGRGASKGVDTSRFRPTKGGPRPPTLGFVGRLSADKGISDLLTVFESCRRALPDCRLIVIGAPDEAQPIGPRTIARLRQRGVDWLGHIDDPASVVAGFDVLVFPSVREGLPNAVIEAAACGVPTVGYQTTGVTDAVEEGINGRVVPLGDVKAMTQATLELLKAPGDMRTSSRRFAVENFDQQVVVRAFVDYLEGLWRKHPRNIRPR